MVRKKDRIPIVIDTNVIVANYLSADPQSPNVMVVRLWRERKLQMIISSYIIDEYSGILAELNIPANFIAGFLIALTESGTVTHVELGKRYHDSHDPKDNVFLSTAASGRAKYVITNDGDLLLISENLKRRYRFRIVTPAEFLKSYYKQS